MAPDDQSGRGSDQDPASGQAERPATQGPAFDDVDSRAADLLARLAARSRPREQPEPDVEPAAEDASNVEPPTPAPEPVGPDPVPTHDAPPPPDDEAWPVRPDVEPTPATPQWEQPPEPPANFGQPDADAPADPNGSGRPRSGRRMATPPWQQGSPAADPFDPGSRYPSVPDWPDDRPDAAPSGAEDDHPGPELTSGTPPPGPVSSPPGRTGPPPPPPTPPRWPGPPPWGSSPPPGPSADAPRVEEPSRNRSQPPPYRPGRSAGGIGAGGWADFDDRAEERKTPQFGWRRVLHQATGGRLNPGLSQRDREQQDLLEQIRQPIASDFRIAVLSIKGGVGKTTTTIGLGSALAMVRADRVIAVDANPDRGTLAERVADTSTTSTVRDLLRDQNITRYADVRNHTRMAPSRLEVLASEQDPAVAEVFGEKDYRRTIEILRNFYNVILTDCGTGIMHSSMASVLDMAHAIVLVSSPAVDAARSAAATLDWLSQHGHGMLARESHVVLSGVPSGPATPQFERVYQYFEERSGSIHVVPFEPHLVKGADIDFELLAPATVQAYLELAGAVAEKFSRVR